MGIESQMKKTKNPKQGKLFDVQPQTFLFDPSVKTEGERIECMARFIVERHKIYLKKSRGYPKPWSKDPVFQTSKFTNIYRELDPGTIWIVDNIVKPYEDHKDLWLMLAIARIINWPDTLQAMMDANVWPVSKWDAHKTFQVLQEIQDRTKLVTGAYLVNSVFPKGYKKIRGSKAEYIPIIAIDPLWKNRAELRSHFKKTSMLEAVSTLTKCHGFGPFIANQVVVDLTYSKKWLGKAPDLNTFTSPGPGTVKGMNWILTGNLHSGISGKKLGPDMIRTRDLVNMTVKKLVPKKYWTGDFRTGFADVSMPNYSNCNCELSKMVRSIQDGGTHRMKNKYDGR